MTISVKSRVSVLIALSLGFLFYFAETERMIEYGKTRTSQQLRTIKKYTYSI